MWFVPLIINKCQSEYLYLIYIKSNAAKLRSVKAVKVRVPKSLVKSYGRNIAATENLKHVSFFV